ncbi:Hypothetical_protein [Hexamita inflata]|uniref:Hypothetical_protein n=1 Tax=Hexamita inflata TaxID=28002 RepID=A0ABP1GK08_9EUKA
MDATAAFALHPVQFQLTALPTIESLRYAFSGTASEHAALEDVVQMISELSRPEAQEFWTAMSQIHQCATALQEHYMPAQAPRPQRGPGPFRLPSPPSSQSLRPPPCSRSRPPRSFKTQALPQSRPGPRCARFREGGFLPDISGQRAVLVNQTVEADSTQQSSGTGSRAWCSKTKKQLYDSFPHLFSKVLFDAQIPERQALIESSRTSTSRTLGSRSRSPSCSWRSPAETCSSTTS